MPLSYNLIRNNSAVVNGGKSIETKIPVSRENSESGVSDSSSREDEIRKSYDIIGANIISKAKHDAHEILIKATNSMKEIEKEAYEKGYSQGTNNGYEDGYNQGYSQAINKGREEVTELINEANNILCKANEEYQEYMQTKKEDIINLALEMAKVIACKEFEKEESVLNLIEPVIEECKGEENIVIKCNSIYVQAIKERLIYWRNAYTVKGEIFILEDPLMEKGNAIIQKNTGKIVVGMDIALKELGDVVKEQILGGNND